MVELLFANAAVSTLDSPITNSDTTLVLAAGHGVRFPNPGSGQAFVVVVQSGSTREIMHCTNRSVDTLTVVRAQEGTTASAFPAGAAVQMLATAGTMDRFVQGPKTIPQNRLLGRTSSGTGTAETVEVGTGLEFYGNTVQVSNIGNYALKNTNNNFSVPQSVPNATAGDHAMNRQTGDARYVRPDQENVFTVSQRIAGELRVDRADSGNEGGRIISRRASDNADGYYWQTFGAGSAPVFRLVRSFGAPAQLLSISENGEMTLTNALTLPGAPTSANHAATKAHVDAAIGAAVNTGTVLAHTANANVADVGTYAFLRSTLTAVHEPGHLVAGSNLRFTGNPSYPTNWSPAGTWRCMGRSASYTYNEIYGDVVSDFGTTLWLRVW